MQGEELLYEVRSRHPDAPALKRLRPALPAKQRLNQAETAALRAKIDTYFAEPEKREDILSGLRNHDVLPAASVGEWAKYCRL